MPDFDVPLILPAPDAPLHLGQLGVAGARPVCPARSHQPHSTSLAQFELLPVERRCPHCAQSSLYRALAALQGRRRAQRAQRQAGLQGEALAA